MSIILRRLASFVVIGVAVASGVAAEPPREAGSPGAPATQPGAAQPGKAEPEKLEPQQCGKIERMHALADVFLASQPAKGDFALVKECGVKTVLNLRPKDELDWDEAEA